MKTHYQIRVSGKVQGVFYRASTQTEAMKFDIKGFVENESNGDVYIEAEGTEEQLKALITWLWKGPDRAIVKSVQVAVGELKNYHNFIIRR